jgi:hypothetical protein
VKAFEIVVDHSSTYIVLATSAERAMQKAVAKREQEYPDDHPQVTSLSELRGQAIG